MSEVAFEDRLKLEHRLFMQQLQPRHSDSRDADHPRLRVYRQLTVRGVVAVGDTEHNDPIQIHVPVFSELLRVTVDVLLFYPAAAAVARALEFPAGPVKPR